MSAIMLKAFGGAGLFIALEQSILKYSIPCLYDITNFGLPRAFAGVILVNVIGSVFLLLSLGMKVGAARKKYGIPLPKMYAEGDSEKAKKFNCVQRSHQQALETYPQFLAMSLISGAFSPVLTTISGLVWNFSRSAWAAGYSTGDPENRYTSFYSFGIWYSVLFVIAGATATAGNILGCI